MDNLFEEFFGETDPFEPMRDWTLFGRRSQPAVNIWEDDDFLYIEAELPGLPEDAFEITVLGRELTLKGERKAEEYPREATIHRRERGDFDFCRVIRLPMDVREDKVEAELKAGVLTIKLPKSETARSRRIKVKALGS
jgi:HSP20 family protein